MTLWIKVGHQEFCPPLEFPIIRKYQAFVVSFCLPATTGRTRVTLACTTSATGGPAPEKMRLFYARSKVIDRYQILDMPDVDLETLGESRLGDMVVESLTRAGL